jgi:hypothetical protein
MQGQKKNKCNPLFIADHRKYKRQQLSVHCKQFIDSYSFLRQQQQMFEKFV